MRFSFIHIVLTLLLVLGIGCASVSYGAEGDFEDPYDLAEQIPGTEDRTVNNFGEYATSLYIFVLSAGIGLALVLIVFGGIEWVSSGGSTSRLSDAKGRIQGALIGLSLLILAVLLLRTINTDLTRIEFNPPKADVRRLQIDDSGNSKPIDSSQ